MVTYIVISNSEQNFINQSIFSVNNLYENVHIIYSLIFFLLIAYHILYKICEFNNFISLFSYPINKSCFYLNKCYLNIFIAFANYTALITTYFVVHVKLWWTIAFWTLIG